ncbi:MAG: TetR/AcrR family transcriptional regulator [Saprospiraceae bacterium]|nr:TetR/AcrR family transcriptional regulator [Candidatus Opimibacter skivensis]MBL0009088.1 TetR/AcrR family transcriptional regulator [Candidatus Opimibacter skivensis]HSF87877.1 TetR/AcrR family transcriptional regulator [Saprospiraceae bacterium]
MGINERKERERDAVKDLILSAAREIFLAEGYENTSIRKIATKIEYSPGIIYNHFKDKNDLLLALHDKAFECKIEALFLSVQNMPDPLERLKATGRGYIQYGIDNPQDYELMFILSCTMEALAVKEEFWQDGAMAINMLKQNIVECMDAGYFRKDINPDEISLILWSQVHGLVSLHNKERLNIYAMEDQKAFMFRSYDVFLSMIQKSLS